MLAAQPAAETLPLLPGRTAMVGLTIAVLTIAYYCIEHRNTQVSTLEAFTITGDEMAEKAAEGDVTRRVAIPVRRSSRLKPVAPNARFLRNSV